MIFVYFIIIFTIVSAIIQIRLSRILINPFSLFCLIWSIILISSILQFYGLYSVSQEIYIMICVGILSFILCYTFFSLQRVRIDMRKSTNGKIFSLSRDDVNYQLVYICSIICLLYYTYYLLLIVSKTGSLSLLSSHNFLRNLDSELIGSKVLRVLASFVIEPISFGLPLVIAADFWSGKRDKFLLVVSFLVVLFKTLATGSRITFLIYFVFILVDGMMVASRNNFFSRAQLKKYKKIITRLVIIVAIAFVILSVSRFQNIWRQLYLNFAIVPKIFEYWQTYSEKNYIYGYGLYSLRGFYYPLVYLFHGGSFPDWLLKINNVISLTNSRWIYAGDGISANAYVSCFWFLYTDLRWFGIILGSGFLGYYSAIINKTVSRDLTPKNLAFYNFCILVIFYTFIRVEVALPECTLALFFLFLTFFKNRFKFTFSMNNNFTYEQ